MAGADAWAAAVTSEVPLAVRIGLAVVATAGLGAAGVVLGLLYVVVRGFSLWRQLKRTKAAFGAESTRIADVSAEIQEQLDRAGASSAALGEASARLAVTRARLEVQLRALREQALADFQALLTAEQLEKFRDLRQALQERRQARRERWQEHR